MCMCVSLSITYKARLYVARVTQQSAVVGVRVHHVENSNAGADREQ